MIFSFGAKMVEAPLDEYLQDPTKISNALRMAQGFFNLEGLITYADPTMMAEAAGCETQGDYPYSVNPLGKVPDDLDRRMAALPGTGRAAVAVEVIKRLNILLPDCILAARITGPVTLARELIGCEPAELIEHPDLLNQTAKGALAMVKAIGDVGIDILFVREEALPEVTPQTEKILKRCYSALWNTAKFYQIVPLLELEILSPVETPILSSIVDGLVIPSEIPPHTRGGRRKLCLSLPVPLLEEEPAKIRAYLEKHETLPGNDAKKIFLLTTSEEIPENIHKEHMIRGIQTVKQFLTIDG